MTQKEVNEQDTVEYLMDLVNYLKEDEEAYLYSDEIMEALEMVMDDLDYLREDYESPPPAGGEGVREVFIDIITLLENAVEDMADFLEDGDEEHLKESLSRIRDANFMIDDLRNAIAQFRLEFAEIVSKINRGEIIEGEPITDDEGNEGNKFNVTDMDDSQIEIDLKPGIQFRASNDEEEEQKVDMKYRAPKTALLKDIQFYRDKYNK